MDEQHEVYQLPANSDQSILKMAWALTAFTTVLIAVVVAVVLNAQSIAKYIPFESEQRFVRPYEAAIKKWFPNKGDPVIDAYLQALANSLSVEMDMPDNYKISVRYVDADVENAFATLGGHIFVFKGLMQQMPDENSLAMVLAHELAHIKHRDPVAAMGRGFAIQMLYGFITNDYSGSIDVLTTSGEVGMSFFSRQQESEADIQAVKALQGHYGHVAGFDSFFVQMRDLASNDDSAPELPEWMSTHPDLDKRIGYLSEFIDQKDYPQNEVKPMPANISSLLNQD